MRIALNVNVKFTRFISLIFLFALVSTQGIASTKRLLPISLDECNEMFNSLKFDFDAQSLGAYNQYLDSQYKKFNLSRSATARVDGDWLYGAENYLSGIYIDPKDMRDSKLPTGIQIYGVRARELVKVPKSEFGEEGVTSYKWYTEKPIIGPNVYFLDSATSLLSAYRYGMVHNTVNPQRLLSDLYDRLYNSNYAFEAGRRENIATYEDQDYRGSGRTTHFAVVLEKKVIAHIQAKASRGPFEKHNFEEIYGPVSRPKNTLTFELGRLFTDISTTNRETQQNYSADRYFRNFVRYSLYQKLFSWLNWDVNPSQIYGQVNDAKLEKFMSPTSPLHFSILKPVYGENGREWILVMNRGQMLSSEEYQTARLLEAQLKSYLNPRISPFAINNIHDELVLKLDRNQIDCLRRLGFLIRVLTNQIQKLILKEQVGTWVSTIISRN